MNLETQIKDPLKFRLSHHGYTILGDQDCREEMPLEKGAMIGGEHYGFTLIVDNNGKQSETTYPTQCRLIGVEILEKILTVYEIDKKIPWQFDLNGNFIRSAQFLKTWRPDVDFLYEHGIVGDSAIDEVNQESCKRR